MRKVAFLVANDECPEEPGIPKLLFPKSDAKTLSEILADKETCGFEPHVHVNEPSHKVLEDLYDICGQLKPDDTLLFYYSGHGMRRGNELCLVSRNTKLVRLIPTSIKATEVLGYLRDSYAKRRILILDCCYSGVIGLQYKAADTDSSLDALGNDFGTCILTASTSIQLSEEREKDGHGLFTKALIDCLREPPKESINVDDWYLYAVDRLRVSESQKPTKCGYVEGHPIEIGSFRQRFARLRRQELEFWISTAREKLQAYIAVGALTKEQVESIMSDLECDEARLLPYKRPFRQAVIRFLKGEASFLEVFGAGHIVRPEPAPKLPEDAVSPPITSAEAPTAKPTVTPPEPADVERPIKPYQPRIFAILKHPEKRAILSWMGGGGVALAGGIWAIVSFVSEPRTIVYEAQIEQIQKRLAEQIGQKPPVISKPPLENAAREEQDEVESLTSAKFNEAKLTILARDAKTPKVRAEARRRLDVITREQNGYEAAKNDIASLKDFVAEPCEACLVQGDAHKQLQILTAAQEVKQADDKISDSDLLGEIRRRLYELNFDPDRSDGWGNDLRQAIHEFEKKNKMAETGQPTAELLLRLRAAPALAPWGAIVYMKGKGKWGMSWGQATRSAAVADARLKCGDSCPVEVSFFGRDCAALAHSTRAWAIMARENVQQAKDAAVAECRAKEGNCRVIASVCADGSELFRAAK